ncbi:MAG: hypothetical protein HKM28_00410 [Flavobacteriaceae bacterium]|nr:hypothetical protein [Flavobacteriaceae bacterium]
MVLKRIKKRSIRKSIEKNLQERDVSLRNAPLKTIGFLVDETQFRELDALHKVGRSLGLQSKDVTTFSFVTFQKKAPSLRQDQIHNKDFNWKGNITNNNASEFLKKDFDVLVGFYHGSNPYLDAMVSESKAKFKIGLKGGDERLFDLLMDVSLQDISLFEKELIKYMKILGKI